MIPPGFVPFKILKGLFWYGWRHNPSHSVEDKPPPPPRIDCSTTGTILRVRFLGTWTLAADAQLELIAQDLETLSALEILFDVDLLEALDTAGAWLISRAQQTLLAKGCSVRCLPMRAQYETLLREAAFTPADTRRVDPHKPCSFLADIGASVWLSACDLIAILDVLGRIVAIVIKNLFMPQRWRIVSMGYHLEQMGLRGAPLIIMINFFVGAIVAQQGIVQLARFGASSLTVDLVAILTLRELGVMLTAIMVAGRSGAAITAELGAMNMRDELNALHVMGLDPLEALVLPRLTALIIALPLLTFLGDLAALTGGMFVTWGLAGVTPQAFWGELQFPLSAQRFWVGLSKAPFMALVIVLIAAMEGFAVEGSAESLGKRVTAAVVKAIFTVILLDGMFAMFYAAVEF